MRDIRDMAKQLKLLKLKQYEWEITDVEREAARRGIAASRKALEEGRRRLASALDAA